MPPVSQRTQWLFLQALSTFIANVAASPALRSVHLTGGELWRGPEEQKRLFEAGKTKVMKSAHRDRVAQDYNIFVEGRLLRSTFNLSEDERYTVLRLGCEWEEVCKSFDLVPEWGGRYGVPLALYSTEVGWDYGHFSIKVTT